MSPRGVTKIQGGDSVGIVIPFHLSKSAKRKSLRNSGLSSKALPSTKTRANFAGMEPMETHWFNDVRRKPRSLATSARFPLALSTAATVIDITSYTSRTGNLSSSPKIHNKVICNTHISYYNQNMANRVALKKGRPYSHVGERLERIQILMGYGEEGGGAQMSKALNLREGQWSVFRSGTREIGIPYASRLCDWCEEYLDGVTLDWIFRGKGPSPRPIQRAFPGLRKGV